MNMIKALREKYKLTQHELAALVKTTQPQIARLEKDERKVTKEWVTRIAPHLRTTPEFLMFGTEGDGSWQSLLKKAIKLALDQNVILTEINAALGALLFSDLSDSAQQLVEQDLESDATVRAALEKGDGQSGKSTGRGTSGNREAR